MASFRFYLTDTEKAMGFSVLIKAPKRRGGYHEKE